ncbi:hypothetical protein ES708_22733 [subsurface metagenome]
MKKKESKRFELPLVKIDRITSEKFLPTFLTKNMFSGFNRIPFLKTLIEKEEEKLGRELSDEELTLLEKKTGEFKDGNCVWRVFSDYMIGFNFKHFEDYLNGKEKEYERKIREKHRGKKLIYPEMKYLTLEEILDDIRIYKQGINLCYAILGEAYLQKNFQEVVIPKERMIYYLGKNPASFRYYHEIKRILSELRWLQVELIGMNTDLVGEGNFLSYVIHTPKNYILGISPLYIGCIVHFFSGEKRERRKGERQELFERGYFTFAPKALLIGGSYSTAQIEFRNYLLREAGNIKLNTRNYKVLSQKIDYYIYKAGLKHVRRNRNYHEFIDNVLPVLIRDKFIAKLLPPLEELKKTKPKNGCDTNLKIYMPKIEELDKRLDAIIEKRSIYR